MNARPLALAAAISLLAGCESTRPTPVSATGGTSFTQHVKPIFERRCIRCHNKYQRPAGLNLQDRDAVLTGTRVGTGQRFIVPGQPQQSLIYHAVTQPAEHPNMMPGDGWGLTVAQEQNVRTWISEGAAWPGGRRGHLREKTLRVEFDDQL